MRHPRDIDLPLTVDRTSGVPLGEQLVRQVRDLVARGVLRGLHFADTPPGQAKYVTCVSGAVLDGRHAAAEDLDDRLGRLLRGLVGLAAERGGAPLPAGAARRVRCGHTVRWGRLGS